MWHEHVSEITSKAWKRINILQTLRFQLDRKSLEIMYFSFVRPILEYADIICDNCYNYEKEAIEKVQYEAGRIVTGATKSCSRANILIETGWDSLEKRRYKHRMITFCKWLKIWYHLTYRNLFPPVSTKLAKETCVTVQILLCPYQEQICMINRLSL